VKFRCRDSWNQNWGSDKFPKGTADFDSYNIDVEACKYHIIHDLHNKTYEFIKLDD